jgi:hypothetical protein
MNRRLKYRNDGIVSILVVIIFSIVVTLIILGFAEISRNQANQTLNNQLNSGAYYAAQSGINEIQNKIINNNSIYESCCPNQGQCKLNFASNNSSQITCYSYNKTPSSLIANLNTSQGKLIHIKPIYDTLNDGNYFVLSFDFQSTTQPNDNGCIPGTSPIYRNSSAHTATFFTFKSLEYNQSCSPGLIRADLSPAPSSTYSSSSSLANHTSTLFMSPKSSSTNQLDLYNQNLSNLC